MQSNDVDIGLRDEGPEQSSVDWFGSRWWVPWVGVDKEVLELCEKSDCGG